MDFDLAINQLREELAKVVEKREELDREMRPKRALCLIGSRSYTLFENLAKMDEVNALVRQIKECSRKEKELEDEIKVLEESRLELQKTLETQENQQIKVEREVDEALGNQSPKPTEKGAEQMEASIASSDRVVKQEEPAIAVVTNVVKEEVLEPQEPVSPKKRTRRLATNTSDRPSIVVQNDTQKLKRRRQADRKRTPDPIDDGHFGEDLFTPRKLRRRVPQLVGTSTKSKTRCRCEKKNNDEMVKCSNLDCPFVWLHFSCARITRKPLGKWYCSKDCQNNDEEEKAAKSSCKYFRGVEKEEPEEDGWKYN